MAKEEPEQLQSLILEVASSTALFMQAPEQMQSFNAVSFYNRTQRLHSNEMLFCQSPVDVLKEVFLLLKQLPSLAAENGGHLGVLLDLCRQIKDPSHKLQVLKAVLMTVKLGAVGLDQQMSDINQMVKEALETATQDSIKKLAIEVLALLMVSSPTIFTSNVDNFLRQIESETAEQSKSEIFAVMLQCLFDSSVVHSLFVKKQPEETRDSLRQMRQLMLKQLRDSDANVRYLATEGFCRLLICESTDKYFEYITRLILLLFERQPTLLQK